MMNDRSENSDSEYLFPEFEKLLHEFPGIENHLRQTGAACGSPLQLSEGMILEALAEMQNKKLLDNLKAVAPEQSPTHIAGIIEGLRMAKSLSRQCSLFSKQYKPTGVPQ